MAENGRKTIAREVRQALKNILREKTTRRVLFVLFQYCSVFDDLPEHEALLRRCFVWALDCAKAPEEAVDVLSSLWTGNVIKSEEAEWAAFCRVLELCRCKEEVEQAVLSPFCRSFPRLDHERYFLEIFARGRELPHRPPEGKMWARGFCEDEDMLLDITEETCRKFGVAHGDRIVAINEGIDFHHEGMVVGVGPADRELPDSQDVLWIAFDGDGGEVSYSSPDLQIVKK